MSTNLLFLKPLNLLAAAAFIGGSSLAQSTTPVFTPGNIVVSRSVYTGDASSVTVGQPLPICPASATAAAPKACVATATDNGAYPSTSSANNVFNNDSVDGSFGITSPLFLDQLNPTTGAVVNTLTIPPDMVTTSFSSKSEVALNLSTDGTALTFMAYVAPPNTIDVSNGNTALVYDPTNPSGGNYFRGVVQVGANGAIQVTPTNTYSGNNGRAAILANGLYYMAGNANNGTGTPANVIASTGVQIATPGQAATTLPQEAGNFSIAQITNPATGTSYAADKLGKDNNFRGLTIFNNTLYVTKGSGSNGINTVYQVGNTGSLPTLANAATAPITILPGFPTALAKSAGPASDYPFGIWFANATTLYVGDEGDGVTADAAGSTTAGIQKWSLVSGTWQLDYVLQKGLNLGQPYPVPNYPTSLNPATGGIRNITGKLNGDGTVTIFGITSTVSANGDSGADPNKLVSIADNLGNLTAAGAASENFTVLKSAVAGEVLRGVSLTPTQGSTFMASVPLIESAASPGVPAIAPGGLAFAFGQNLALGFPNQIFGPLPTAFDATSVAIVDAAGNSTQAPLLYVSPAQVTFVVPSGVAAGTAKVIVTGGGATQTASNVQIAKVAPALFSINGSSLADAYGVRVSAAGAQTIELAYALNSLGSYSATPISMGSATDQVYLVLYGTGIQAAGLANVTVTVAGLNAPVAYAGPSLIYAGVDQINIQLPASLAGKGNSTVILTAAGIASNPVQVTIQ